MLHLAIPFNAPHGYSIHELRKSRVSVFIPYRRRNRNHIGGLHACCLATAAEFASGLLVFQNISLQDYRLIMKSLTVQYTYQGKGPAYVICDLPESLNLSELLEKLNRGDALTISLCSRAYDQQEHQLCEAQIEWQLKSWKKVKTPVT